MRGPNPTKQHDLNLHWLGDWQGWHTNLASYADAAGSVEGGMFLLANEFEGGIYLHKHSNQQSDSTLL